MKASVIVCVYNGEKYICEQLESLRLQTRKADEVLIFDDCSTDNSPAIIEKYIKDWGLSWTLVVNKENKGWKRNFTDGFKLATGDVIFCCDQDDIWYPEKMDIMCCLLSKDCIKLVACKVRMCDENGNTLNRKLGAMPNSNESGKVSNIVFDEEFYMSREPGCAIAFKRELLDIYFKFWEEYYPHDQLLWNIAKCLDGAYEIDKMLMDYRRVSSSVFESNSCKRSSVNRLRKIYQLGMVMDVICNIIEDPSICVRNVEEKKKYVLIGKSWIKHRKKLIKDKRLFSIISLLRYIKYYKPLIVILADCYDFLKFSQTDVCKRIHFSNTKRKRLIWKK